MIKRINKLIDDTMRDPSKGIGKPEPLKGDLSVFGPDGSTTRTDSCTSRPTTS
ncbi:hypothetical protein SSOG_06036 [Streptomyces himastatinicus ATCC 53653]|uniref:Endoribonuclease YoeB n=1 Tax=Streptomyces himastatinicus ATCC 53653 TaxID=457427 RepID=D9WTA1_9ACTN|nr:hypothetical protein SSOG_06036 [Streptomyces himastatinicus ATCC 53653]